MENFNFTQHHHNSIASSSNTPSSMSMSSMAISMSGISKLTKKVSNNISQTISNNINIATSSSNSSTNTVTINDHHTNIKRKSIDNKAHNIAEVMKVIQDVKLVCPSSHAGFILAFNGSNLSPVINPGIKFTWYRMSHDKIDPIDGCLTAWYAPTVDDIGSIICAQCSDNYDQGCSRYNEVSSTVDHDTKEKAIYKYVLLLLIVALLLC